MSDNISPTHNQPEYSVSEISGALKRVVEDTFGFVRVRGEISGFKRAASGHCYMDLKDDKAVLNAVCWKGVASRLSFQPEDGLEVICTGKLSTYPGRSNYQLIIDNMEPAGEGALMALLEKRKKELAKEGLFDEARKQKLPYLPETIGIVTSPTGAVIRDILHRLEERFPTHVLVWPVRVQGEGAAEEIAEAIRGFNAPDIAPKIDLLIVARGGGSLEDLWCFNEENVVRAAAESTIPLISAVGHETDTTLIDYASDKRAPTPTAAAEMAVPVRAELLGWVKETDTRLFRGITQLIKQNNEKIEGLARGLPKPTSLLMQQSQRLDSWTERLSGALPVMLQRKQASLTNMSGRLTPTTLKAQIKQLTERLHHLEERKQQQLKQTLKEQQQKLDATSRMLESLNYQNVLKRGYAIVRTNKEQIVTSTTQVSEQNHLSIEFQDGKVDVTTSGVPKKRSKPSPQSPTQDSLF